jgi:hypothetical protein
MDDTTLSEKEIIELAFERMRLMSKMKSKEGGL